MKLECPLIHDLTVEAISSWHFGPAYCLLFTVYLLWRQNAQNRRVAHGAAQRDCQRQIACR